jgi:hypothetical protein
MRYGLSLLIVILMMGSTTSTSGLQDGIQEISLVIVSHDSNFSKEDAQEVIKEANTILLYGQAHFQLKIGNFISYNDFGDADCDTIEKLFAMREATIHVVQYIYCCNHVVYSHTLVGCSGTDLPAIVLPVSRNTFSDTITLRAVEWLHEIGHSRGLGHINDTTLIMQEIPTSGSTGLDSCYRQIFSSNLPSSCISLQQQSQ